MFASICCNTITTTAISIVFPIPPVNSVIIIESPTATIAPKYGIKLNSPIMNPSSIAYFTFIIDIATDANIPTIIASIIWLVRKLKNI